MATQYGSCFNHSKAELWPYGGERSVTGLNIAGGIPTVNASLRRHRELELAQAMDEDINTGHS